MVVPRIFCSNCGAPHALPLRVGHQVCPACRDTDWFNPVPVAVCLVPVQHRDFYSVMGLLTLQRNIPPALGQYSLPCGHVEPAAYANPAGESLEQAAQRELREETGLSLELPTLRASAPTPNGQILALCRFQHITPAQAASAADYVRQDFQVNPAAENSSARVDWQPQPLAFPLHTQWAAEFFRAEGWHRHRSADGPADHTALPT